MPKFLGIHTFPPGAFTEVQVRGLAAAGQLDPLVRGYRSFVSLTAGKAVCVMEGPDRAAVAAWFRKVGIPTDSITPLDLEGECGDVRIQHDDAVVA